MPDSRSEKPSTEERSAGGDGPPLVTIAYIAESAGVSVPTVSKVLNGRSGVSDETRARVEELIHRYGYRKPPKSRGNLVELVFRELESMWAVEIIRGVERVARRNRVGVLVSEFGLHDTEAMTIDDTVGRRPQCVLSVAQLSEAEREQLKAKGIPFVVFDPIDELGDAPVPQCGQVPGGGRSRRSRPADGPSPGAPHPAHPGARLRRGTRGALPARSADRRVHRERHAGARRLSGRP